jgi:hypothetical protein
MQKFFARFLSLLVFFSAISLFAGAQESASITGIVTDSTGAVVPDVAVALENATIGTAYKATTNTAGSFLITSVPPGPGYKISFSRDGFQSYTATGLYLNVRSTRTQNAVLKVGNAIQTVAVSAGSETVTLNTADATVGNNFQVQFVNDLPIQNRDNPSALFVMQPGVTDAGSVTGARTDQTNVSLDGLDVSAQATGTFGAIIASAPVDAVQEFRGTVAGTNADTGQGGGGHFDMVTKSGTNQFHGALVEYHRDTDLTANDWFSNDSSPKTARSPLIRNQFGGNIGGPIKKNKAFFFFDYAGRHDTINSTATRTVPTTTFKNGELGYINTAGSYSYLSSDETKALDPSGSGFNSQILSLFKSRYPDPNLSGGDGYNTSHYRFNAPTPLKENVFTARLDYKLNDKMNLFARFTIQREDSTESVVQFLGDPITSPYINRDRAWVIGHTWTVNDRMTNNISWGQTVEDVSFPNTYNPQGITQFTFGATSSGGTILSQPYASAVNAQNRIYPVPVLRDDFTLIKGRHSIQIGGLFKYINPFFNTILNYNKPSIGVGGAFSTLDDAERPSDFGSGSSAYDAAFTTALGRYSSQTSVYNYDAKGNVLTQGSGLKHNYRYYEMEFYAQDSWKLTPRFTLSFGLRWINYTVPYDKKGTESAPNLDFDTYWGDREVQSAAGLSGDTVVPFISYSPSGKANGAAGMLNPQRHNFAPHVAFNYTPSFDSKTVINGSVGVDYDRTVVSALLYQQSQYSYVFQASSTSNYGASDGDATESLTGDSRFAGISSPITAPTAPVMSTPYTPYVTDNVPNGLASSTWNTAINKNFKTPYSITFNLGFQHEIPHGFLWKVNYAGRLGRRLMAQADANQLIDFPDSISGQKMSEAIANLEKQIRSGVSWKNVTTQPWFENVLQYSSSSAYTHTQRIASSSTYNYLLGIGDFADTMYYLSYAGHLPAYVGMGSQFSNFTYYTNKGFSNYHGLMTTIHKNAGFGLQFDLNYTWSHSIDNVSVTANTVASSGYGFVCDINRPRECRGNSDFDATNVFNGNFIYELPIGRGKAFGATMPRWADELAGGWSVSGLPTWRSGYPYFAYSEAFVAGYSNNAPAVLTGNIGDLKTRPHKDSTGAVWMYKDVSKSLDDYVGPTGFDIGSRNNLRDEHAFSLDLGLGKTFPIHDRARLVFRCDAFNALNHPVFAAPGSDERDVTESSASFGQVTGTSSTPRVLQGALRFEF